MFFVRDLMSIFTSQCYRLHAVEILMTSQCLFNPMPGTRKVLLLEETNPFLEREGKFWAVRLSETSSI